MQFRRYCFDKANELSILAVKPVTTCFYRIPVKPLSTMNKLLQLVDVVALLTDLPDEKLSIGQVGTIVEEMADGVYEVEFADTKGRTLTTCAVQAKDLLKLTHELAA